MVVLMKIKNFFHKLKIGFVRLKGASIPYVSSAKKYGENGEKYFTDALKNALPSSQIKNNVVINTQDGNAEIDCLVLYRNKLFAIEVKRWKGRLTETVDGFIQEKTDRWTSETHIKQHKSPFKQLNRAIYLLKKQISGKIWINSVVYFEDKVFEGISTSNEYVWFSDINDLVNHIKNDGKITYDNNEAKRFFAKCISADYLYANSWGRYLHCVITPESLNIQTEQGIITRKDISHIHIVHHFSYDELNITLNDASNRRAVIENGKVKVNDGGIFAEYSFCKLDYIEIGK